MLSDTELRRLMAMMPAQLMEASVLDPPLDADGWLRVEIDNRPGQAESCPWMPREDGVDPAPRDAAAVVESDGGNFWVVGWWPQNGQSPDAGASGTLWFTGAGAPAGGLADVGDLYLDSSSGDYYEKTGAAAWTLRGNLRGPEGAQGIQGEPGPTGAEGPQGPPGEVSDAELAAATAMRTLNFQRIAGNNAGYAALAHGENVRRSSSVDLSVSYTPPVDCWWEVTVHVGLMQVLTGPGLVYLGAAISPADVDGLFIGYQRETDDGGYTFRVVRRTFKLAAGIAYTARGVWSLSTGTYQYHQGDQFLWLEAKAFAR
jgi:hypothetical protein